MNDAELMKIVEAVAEHLIGWRCDRRESRPKLLGPNGAYVVIKVERGTTIRFVAIPPKDIENRYRSWRGWGITLAQWRIYAINCNSTRPPKHIAHDINRRLLMNVVKFWPVAMEAKRQEQEQADQLELVLTLFMRMIPSAKIADWQSSKHRKQFYFEGGEGDLSHYGGEYPAKLVFNRLSYDDALKMAAFYHQLLTEKANINGQEE